MQEHATDDQVFIRSMASRGHLGGLSAATPQAIRVLDAAGFDLIIVETVGMGRPVAVASLADSVVVLLAQGIGDAVQAADAGILEVADLFVVNKADKPDTQQVVRDLRNMIALGQGPGLLEAADHRGHGHQGPARRGRRRAGHPPGRALGVAGLRRRAAAAPPRPGRARRSPRWPTPRCGTR